MAVKVMVAPTIARGELEPVRPPRRPRGEGQKRPRRRSSVFDADGNEVFITLMCLKCRRMRPLSQFGLRRMADGAIRNQPWCRICRSGASPRSRADAAAETDSAAAADSPIGAPPALPPEPPPADAGALAAQVAAALHRGRG